ncbi:hypothetical protein BOMU111920_24380 [Bordetella muralis]
MIQALRADAAGAHHVVPGAPGTTLPLAATRVRGIFAAGPSPKQKSLLAGPQAEGAAWGLFYRLIFLSPHESVSLGRYGQ